MRAGAAAERKKSMFAEERQKLIRDAVRKNQRLTFTQLQELVEASPATLRRDLTELEQSGEVIRVHGGVLDPAYVRQESSFGERLDRNRGAKQAIARIAASLVPPGATVLLDAGSTCLEAGKILLARKDVRIVTHSVALLEPALHGEAEVVCVGGALRKVSGALVGGAALNALALLRGDVAFVAATGLEPLGCTTTELSEAEIKQALLAGASRRVLLADSGKWGQSGTVRFTPWDGLTDFVTEQPLPVSQTKLLREAGVKLHLP